MLEYYKLEDRINIKPTDEFDIEQILNSGQVFRFYENLRGFTYVFSGDKYCKVCPNDDGSYDIVTKDVDYFESFFNLKTDYNYIKNWCYAHNTFDVAVDYSSGLRIIKGDPLEIIVTFIISANNNISRIKKIVNELCRQKGEPLDDVGYAFPTIDVLLSLDEQFYKSIGAGYRSAYLVKAMPKIKYFLDQYIPQMPSVILEDELLKISGVGKKVANCIMLFAFNKFDCFPVDVWIERAYHYFYGNDNLSRSQISEKLSDKFGNYSGYVQQYWFNYFVNIKNIFKN